MRVDILKKALLPSPDPYVIVTDAVQATVKLERMAKELLLSGKVDMAEAWSYQLADVKVSALPVCSS